mmetsp:Transcript_2457/g.3774  ORF Transcript_2457/g.3774 Transcript_2457/m.3774 type:complete len:241 (+) Transcript_2457:603-1325(+)
MIDSKCGFVARNKHGFDTKTPCQHTKKTIQHASSSSLEGLRKCLHLGCKVDSNQLADPARNSYIVLMRDPRDVTISECFHRHPPCSSPILERVIHDRLPCITAWVAARYIWHSAKFSRNTHFVFYERLLHDTSAYYPLCDALNVSCTESILEKVIDATTPKETIKFKTELAAKHHVHKPHIVSVRSAGRKNYLNYSLSSYNLKWMETVLRNVLPPDLVQEWVSPLILVATCHSLRSTLFQ